MVWSLFLALAIKDVKFGYRRGWLRTDTQPMAAPANTSEKGLRLLSSHAKIRKINVNAPKTQVIALKVIKCYSLPCTIKVLIGILYRETQISNKILPWDAAVRPRRNLPGNTRNTFKENNTTRGLGLLFLNLLIVFSEKWISLWTKISETMERCKDNH